MFTILWKFKIEKHHKAQFIEYYKADGLWVQLFRKSPEFIATELIQSVHSENEFLTIDHWRNREGYLQFKVKFQHEYNELDAHCQTYLNGKEFLGEYQSYDTE